MNRVEYRVDSAPFGVWTKMAWQSLGTDGFGRSDFRAKLREHFEVNRHFVVLAALRALADEGAIPQKTLSKAVKKYGIRPDKANPHHA